MISASDTMAISQTEALNQGKKEMSTTSTMPAFLARLPRPLAGRAFKQPQQEEPQQKQQPASLLGPPGCFLLASQPVTKGADDIAPTAVANDPWLGQSIPPQAAAASDHGDQWNNYNSEDAALPPVVRVKKSHRGCAKVILRDSAIIDRCALQRVAVIDGVCVEMKRHCKKSNKEEHGEQEEQGIFCAWGVKVERKVPVSEEGIEEFFNSLSGKPCPEGLVATAPFKEHHLSFPLASEGFAMLSFAIQETEASKEQVLSSPYCTQPLIESSWAAKDRLDALWARPPPPMARSLITRVARSQLFQHSGEGGQEHENRAGDKLAQISEIIGLLDGIPDGAAFLDLCGGPGAWSQHLLEQKAVALKGFGFTLKSASGNADDWQAQDKDDWYEDLNEHAKWTALWGKDGTGDLLKKGNLEHCVKALSKEHVLLVVADGGFSDDSIPPNLLELYFYRLFLAELLTAALCLSIGGKFVCKLYSTFSDSTAALLFLTTQLFDSVEIVKPMSSKATGPERYLTATGFRDDAQTAVICAALTRSHALGAGCSPLVMPLLSPVVPAESLQQDETFSAGMRNMVTEMCDRQTKALNAVVDRHDVLEDIAMSCAVCTDPWARRAPAPREREEMSERRERRPNHLPTPSRARGGKKGQWQ